MALQKDITTNTGAIANYAKVATTEVCKNKIKGDLNLYTSKEAKDNGYKIADNFKFEYTISLNDLDNTNPIALAYAKIKESYKVEDTDNETNLLTGNSGKIGFQDSIDI